MVLREEAVLGAERVGMDLQARAVGVVDQRGRRQQAIGGVARDDLALVGPEPVGVAGDPAQAARRRQVGVGARVPLRGEVVRAAGRARELDERHAQLARELLQVGDLEGLDEHVGIAAVEAVDPQRPDERLLEREPDRVEVRRMLGLGVDADPLALGEVDDLLQGRDLIRAVEGRVARAQQRQRSIARRVLSSASVKSSVNQPVTAVPSIVLVVRRAANSGCAATSVVPEISFSWRATSTRSLVATTSGSM